jgi:hypothetical protein
MGSISKRWIAFVAAGPLWIGICPPVAAQEFTLFGGATRSLNELTWAFAWKFEYRRGLGEHFELSYAYRNDGHVQGHHMDGHSLQFWARENLFDRRLSVALGAGGTLTYDTVRIGAERDYDDDHGVSGIASADVAWYAGKRWIVRAEVNRTFTGRVGIDTWGLLAGS